MFFASLLLVALISGLIFSFITGSLQSFYASYPIPTMLAAAADLLLASYLYGNVRPGFRGRLIGYQLFYGFTEKGVYRRFDGVLTDISHFLTEPAISAFKALAIQDLEDRLKDKTLSSSIQERLENVRNRLNNLKALDLHTRIKIYGCRRDFVRHVWVILADKSIEQYSVASYRVAFTFPFGFLRRSAIFGIRYDLKGWYKITPYGKCKVHLFIPLIEPRDRRFEAKLSALNPVEREALASLGSSITAALHLHSENRRLRSEIKAMRKRHDEMTKELARMAKMLDAARTAARAKTLIPPTEEEARLLGMKPASERYFQLASAMLFTQVAFAALLPRMLGLDPIISAALGSIVGLFMFQIFMKE